MNDLHPNAQKVQDALDAAGLETTVQRLSKETRTAAAAAAELGCVVGAIANSLVFMADGEPLLVMTSGAHRVDEAFLAAEQGIGELRSANAAEVRGATGQPIGGVAPLAHPAKLPALIDGSLAQYEEIWVGGGAPNSIFPLTYEQLLQITGGTVVAVNAAGPGYVG